MQTKAQGIKSATPTKVAN